jgi:hypothetical protein
MDRGADEFGVNSTSDESFRHLFVVFPPLRDRVAPVQLGAFTRPGTCVVAGKIRVRAMEGFGPGT